MYKYNAKIRRWIDGDTVVLDVDLGFRIQHKIHVRLFGLDAPEVRGAEKESGKVVRDFCDDAWPPGFDVQLDSRGTDKYGRYVGTMMDGHHNLNKVISEFIDSAMPGEDDGL